MTDAELLAVLHAAATAVHDATVGIDDWGALGSRDGQYQLDLVADQAAVSVLTAAGLGVVSEESGVHPSTGITVVLDPIDGSTNASRGIPWYNTSLCAVDGDGLRAAVVVDQVRCRRFEAVRGAGARCDGQPLRPSGAELLSDSLLGLNGYPPVHLGWKQYRALGSAALDLCAVAAGVLDGFIDCTRDGLSPWDYLGGVLICQEAGARIATLSGGRLDDVSGPHVVVAAGTPQLLAGELAARRRFG